MELTEFQPATATIKVEDLSGRISPDVSATVSYQEGHGFTLTWGIIVGGPKGPPIQTRQLNEDDLDVLLAKVNDALANDMARIDADALRAFKSIIESHLGAGASVLFNAVKFGQTFEEIFGGKVSITGHVGFGIDVVGTIHEAAGLVTWEHHVLPRPPGPYRPLTPGERDALKTKLGDWLKDNPEEGGWQQIFNAL